MADAAMLEILASVCVEKKGFKIGLFTAKHKCQRVKFHSGQFSLLMCKLSLDQVLSYSIGEGMVFQEE